MDAFAFNARLLKLLRDQPEGSVTLERLLDDLMSSEGIHNREAETRTDTLIWMLVACTAPSDLPIDGTIAHGVGRKRIKQWLLARLGQLEKAGLIDFKKMGWRAESDIRISLKGDFPELQRALGFSLTEIAERKSNSMTMRPVFGIPEITKCDVFVIMPFLNEMSNVYSLVAGCCASLNLSVQRADDLFGASHVIDDIWDLINSAKIVVCDCTHKNPNVFYELGIAHTVGKPVILITQNESDVPFDLRHWRYLLYPKNRKGLADGLTVAIRNILSS
jgi:hypothetical protein